MDMPEQSFGGFVEELDYFLRHVSHIVRQRGRAILADFDITPPQFNALLHLRGGRDLTMGELCDRLFLASSTVTDLVDRMEKNGLVERVRDAEDRRAIRLRMTALGEDVLRKVIEARSVYLSGILEKVPEDEKAHLLAALKHVYSLMSAVT
jgi:DNA-binding MarR family transcriptional regulator